MRKLIGLLIALPGVGFLKLAELVAGEKMAYRGEEVLQIKKVNARCSVCGHQGALYDDNRIDLA